MKWIAAILMILNVTVYLWASGNQVETSLLENPSSPDVNKEGMLLLSEAGGTKQFGIIATGNLQKSLNTDERVAKSDDSDDGQTSQSSERTTGLDTGENLIITEDIIEGDEISSATAVGDSLSGSAGLAAQCYRIGPFRKPEPWEVAQNWLSEQGVSFKHVTSESRELRAVRVYLGPYSSTSEAQTAVKLLESKNLDHFVYQLGDGATRVSLGYFTQEELATKFLDYLAGIKVEAQSQPEYRILGPFNWMEISAQTIDLDLLRGHDWVEDNVGLSRLDC